MIRFNYYVDFEFSTEIINGFLFSILILVKDKLIDFYFKKSNEYLEAILIDKNFKNSITTKFLINFSELFSSTSLTTKEKIALLLCCIRKNKEETEIYVTILSFQPQNVIANVNLSKIYLEQRNFEKSIYFASQAIKIDFNYSLAYLNRGLAYQMLGKYNEAMSNYNEAIEINPTFELYYINRSSLYILLGEYIKAIKDAELAMSINNKHPLAYVNRGYAYQKLGKYSKAMSDYKKAILIDPQNKQANINIKALEKLLQKHI